MKGPRVSEASDEPTKRSIYNLIAERTPAACFLARAGQPVNNPEKRSRLETDGGAVAAMVELMSIDISLLEHARLASFRVGDSVKVWNYRRATRAIRQIAEREGMGPKRVSLHSIRAKRGTLERSRVLQPNLKKHTERIHTSRPVNQCDDHDHLHLSQQSHA